MFKCVIVIIEHTLHLVIVEYILALSFSMPSIDEIQDQLKTIQR